jgi:hypothetical protein
MHANSAFNVQCLFVNHPVIDSIRHSLHAGLVQFSNFNGRYSNTSLIVTLDDKTKYFLKFSNTEKSPASGMNWLAISSAKREVAAYEIAKILKIEQFFPFVIGLRINGCEVAAVKILENYRNLYNDDLSAEANVANARKNLEPFRISGDILKWSIFDWICLNCDRHAQNMMYQIDSVQTNIKLIDHGSTFAGPDFSPHLDKYSFIPYYLRYFAPQANVRKLSIMDTRFFMTTVPIRLDDAIKMWIEEIDVSKITETLKFYGVNPSTCLEQLRKIKTRIARLSVSDAMNSLWIGDSTVF